MGGLYQPAKLAQDLLLEAGRCLGTQALREATPKPTAHAGEGPLLHNPLGPGGFLF